MRFLDTESVGLIGPAVLIQHAIDDGPIILHEVFKSTVTSTLELIEDICQDTVVGFNLTHDWFHLTKIYNLLRELKDKYGYTDVPAVDYIHELEPQNPSTWCLKPRRAVDLMLSARRDKYQGTMAHPDVTIRRIPTVLIDRVKNEVEKRIQLSKIYFTKRRDGYKWDVEETQDPQFSDLVLRFGGSTSLGSICEAEFGEAKDEWPIPDSILPNDEIEWAPYRIPGTGNNQWRDFIFQHIVMWNSHPKARHYAERDIYLTRRLGYHWQDRFNEDTYIDGQLACLVGGARWKGYSIDQQVISDLIVKYSKDRSLAPRAPSRSLAYLHGVMDAGEKALVTSTDKVVLNEVATWETEAGTRAKNIQLARKADKRLDILNKLKQLKSFHPNFKIIGARSNRMSGGTDEGKAESINPQGIPRGDFRKIFTLAFTEEGEWLEGGDADSFETSIMDAVWKDENLHADLLSGKKFHGLWGALLLNVTYESIMADKAKYDRIKNGDFAWGYGAQVPKIANTIEESEETVEAGLVRIEARYPGIKRAREETHDLFCSMTQPNGIGTAVIWKDPQNYAESIFGFRRDFTIDNVICKSLFQLANNLPANFRDFNEIKITRRDRIQTPAGATQSALFAAAFNIQSKNLRQANNHRIQSPGATITKRFQYEIWCEQPTGVHIWIVRPMNIHDEILCPTRVDLTPVRDRVIDYFRPNVPLLKWGWGRMDSWYDK